MMTKSLRCVSSKARKSPYYDGLTDVDLFLDDFKCKVAQDQCFQPLELVLCLHEGVVRIKIVLMDGEIT